MTLGMVALVAAKSMSPTARAESYPFALTAGVNLDTVAITCGGPWFRTSDCSVVPARGKRTVFYAAESGVLPVAGEWYCQADTKCSSGSFLGSVTFCGPGGGNAPKDVELTLYRDLKSNQASSCTGTRIVTRSVLGQTGEADDTPAQDTDTYRFPGKAGEKVEVKLERDGSTGSLGEVATLRLRAPDGASLGEATGPVPLRLKATLPGEVEVLVLRDGKTGSAFRGGYALEVKPLSGDLGGRTLRPTENVEG
jgi:hypothetical protein